MGGRDGSPPRGSADRRQASSRRDHYSPPRRNYNGDRDRRCPDCDFSSSSMENLRRHFQTTDHNRRDGGRTRDTGRSGKDRDPDRTRSSDRERNRKPETTSRNDREKDRKPESRLSKNPEKDRKPETTLRNDRETDRKAGVPEKHQKPEPTGNNDPEKQKKTEPTPSNVPKKPDPPQSLVQGVVPEHIRRSVYLLKDYLPIKDREPVIGLEYILEYRVHVRDRVDVKYFCELCEMDSGVVPMLDHVCGFKHRKLYVAKAYPFVLKALFSSKEDRALFMRRMAVEIEEEEGIKMYKSDPVIRMVPMMNVKSTEAKQSKRKTRWDPEGERQNKMKQALEFLDSFEIEGDDEAATVTKLLQKVTSVVKLHTDKLKEEALFPLKVTRAQGVAKAIVQDAIRARLAKRNIFPLLGNLNFHILGRRLQPNNPYRPPNAAFPQMLQGSPFFQLNQNHNPHMPPAQANSDLETEETDEDIEFFKQLIALLELLPESPTPTNNSKMDSEILMLQSLLLDTDANLENTPANQLPQADPMTMDRARKKNVSPYQQLNKNPASMGQFSSDLSMPMASTAPNAPPVVNAQSDQNLLMEMVELIQNRQTNVNSSLPENQNIKKRECIQRGNSSAVIVNKTAHRQQYMEHASTSRSKEDFGFERLMAGKYGNANKRQYDDSGVFSRDWDEPSYSNISSKGANRAHDDYKAEQGPLSRVSLPPNIQRSEKERFQGNSYDQDLRQEYRSHEPRPNYGGRSSRSFDDPTWAERAPDTPYGKRAKLDSDFATPQSTDWKERHPDGGGSLDTGISNLSVDLLKKIRGKDLFTVSAILSEYADSHPSN
ncbi:unnamed protein product [Staurois parvus]|uniref:Uncharacterized protein n=1 Tax=Staurois parvus TaxID=386267 RepID=A0ABN9AQQ3_9NEOB|nr:unnamed protein product [Staurois parvus]